MHFHWLLTLMVEDTRMASTVLVFLFSHPKNPSINIVLYKTNRLHFSVHVYCNSSQRTSLKCRIFCSLHAVTSSVIYYSTHARKNVIYLLNIACLPSQNVPLYVIAPMQSARVLLCISLPNGKCITLLEC